MLMYLSKSMLFMRHCKTTSKLELCDLETLEVVLHILVSIVPSYDLRWRV